MKTLARFLRWLDSLIFRRPKTEDGPSPTPPPKPRDGPSPTPPPKPPKK